MSRVQGLNTLESYPIPFEGLARVAPNVLFCDQVLAPYIDVRQEPSALMDKEHFKACLNPQAVQFHLRQQPSQPSSVPAVPGPMPCLTPLRTQQVALVAPAAADQPVTLVPPTKEAPPAQAAPPVGLLAAGTAGTVLLTGMAAQPGGPCTPLF